MRVVTDAGVAIELGDVETQPTVGIIDYSRRVTDDFGVTTVVQRGFARRMSVRLAVPFDAVDALQRQLADLRATPAQWIADDRFASLSFRGFYKEFELDLATQPLSYCTLSVEGLAASDAVADAGHDPAPDGAISTLQLLQPIAITDAILVSSSVPETDQPMWSQATVYARGARVIRTDTHRVYESLIAGNVGHDPTSDTANWLNVGPTNRWAMFDQALGTATTAATRVSVSIAAATISAIALLDVVGDSVRVQAYGYDRTIAVAPGALTFLDLPANPGQITVTVSGANAAIGTLLAGSVVTLGLTEASPTAGITDYSRKAVDDFGAVSVVKRAWAKRMSAVALIRTDAIDAVSNRIAAVRALPSLWIGQAGIDSLTVYGFFKEFQVEVGETLSKLSLSIEGLSQAAKIDPLKIPVNWGDILDPADTKPANNATVGGTIGVDVKDGTGKIVQPTEILNSALSLTKDGILNYTSGGRTIPLGSVGLPDLGAATEAARRKLDADIAAISAAVAQLAAGQAIVQNVFRDAGLFTDPASGIAKLFAIESRAEQVTKLSVTLNAALGSIGLKADTTYVDQAILNAQLSGQAVDLNSIFVRLTSAEANINSLSATVELKADAKIVNGLQGTVTAVQQSLDALNATIATKASKDVVDVLGQRLTLAEQTISAFDGASITQSVTAARRAPLDADKAGETAILDLLSGANAQQLAVTGLAMARTELGARITGAFDAIASATLQLGVQIGAVNASVAQATAAQIAGDQALASQIASYQAATNANLASVNQALVAQTDTNRSIAAQLTTLNAGYGQQQQVITDANAARDAGDKAVLGMLSLTNATVSRNAQASADRDSALASNVDALATTVGSHTNTLRTYGQSIDGLSASYGAEITQDGIVTGYFQLNGSGKRVDAAFLVTSFKIAIAGKPGFTPFVVDETGTVTMPAVVVTNLAADTVATKHLKVGAVDYDQLALGSAGVSDFYTIPNDVSIQPNASTTVLSKSFTKFDDASVLELLFFANMKSGNDLIFTLALQIDGNTVQTATAKLIFSNANSQGQMPSTFFAFVPGLAAGAHTLTVAISNNEQGAAGPLVAQRGSTIKISELRKASLGSSVGGGSSPTTSGGSMTTSTGTTVASDTSGGWTDSGSSGGGSTGSGAGGSYNGGGGGRVAKS